MINKVTWATMKACIDSNPNNPYFYDQETYYCSDDSAVSDIYQYFIRQELITGVENNTFIVKDGGADQIDFDDNYKAGGIETI